MVWVPYRVDAVKEESRNVRSEKKSTLLRAVDLAEPLEGFGIGPLSRCTSWPQEAQKLLVLTGLLAGGRRWVLKELQDPVLDGRLDLGEAPPQFVVGGFLGQLIQVDIDARHHLVVSVLLLLSSWSRWGRQDRVRPLSLGGVSR